MSLCICRAAALCVLLVFGSEKYDWEYNVHKSLTLSDLQVGVFWCNGDYGIHQLDLAIQGSLRTGNIPGTRRFGSQCCM